jgi:DNA polymerase I-like protein with 3'-5' exonuclease and polymerase domains
MIKVNPNKSITVFDCETSVNNHGVGNFKASPFYVENKVVAIGYARFSSTMIDNYFVNARDFANKLAVHNNYFRVTLKPHARWEHIKNNLEDSDILVGHNLGFDLHYIRKLCPSHIEWRKLTENMIFYDTMIGAFILSDQTRRFPSLDDLSKDLGLPLKDKTISELWEAGVKTEDIDSDLLKSYLAQDVRNTAAIFCDQMRKLEAQSKSSYAFMEMESFRVTNEMEWNGIKVSLPELNKQDLAAASKCLDLASQCCEHAHDLAKMRGIDYDVIKHYSPTSDRFNSVLLFGGELPMTVEDLVLDSEGLPIVYKTGAKAGVAKTKKVTHKISVKGLDEKVRDGVTTPTKDGHFSVDRKTLLALREVYITPGYVPVISSPVGLSLRLCEVLLDYREWSKILNTYLKGINNHVWPDGMIHHSLNHCVAITGRLSSSNPNLQNQAG